MVTFDSQNVCFISGTNLISFVTVKTIAIKLNNFPNSQKVRQGGIDKFPVQK